MARSLFYFILCTSGIYADTIELAVTCGTSERPPASKAFIINTDLRPESYQHFSIQKVSTLEEAENALSNDPGKTPSILIADQTPIEVAGWMRKLPMLDLVILRGDRTLGEAAIKIHQGFMVGIPVSSKTYRRLELTVGSGLSSVKITRVSFPAKPDPSLYEALRQFDAAKGLASSPAEGNRDAGMTQRAPPSKTPAPGEWSVKTHVAKRQERQQARYLKEKAEHFSEADKERLFAAREAEGLAGVGITEEQVNLAITRGADFLWSYIKTNDLKVAQRPFGYKKQHTLAALALVHSKANHRHPDLNQALRAMLGKMDGETVRKQCTYENGLLCMLVDANRDPTHLPILDYAITYLVEGQGELGLWGYRSEIPPFPARPGKPLQVRGGQPLDREKEPWSRKSDPDQKGDGDNSVSQFAILGLHTTERLGIPLEHALWKRTFEYTGQRQNPDGGWSYSTGGRSYGSMTAAGVCALAISGHFSRPNFSPMDHPPIQRGLVWLMKHFSVSNNPKRDEWGYYYLYSVERVGRILQTEFIGPHEWYPKGAKHLIKNQMEHGGWIGANQEKDPRLATSFALLFLTRATATLSETIARGGDGYLETRSLLPAEPKVYIILDASGSMLAEMGTETKFDLARNVVASVVKALPDNAQVALRVYGHRLRAIQEGANQDTHLEIPLETINKGAFTHRLNQLRCRGKTPLSLSLTEALNDLKGSSPKDPVTLVLLTDGAEDTRLGSDPVAAASTLGEKKGISLHIIGFDINEPNWRAQLLAMAQGAGGHYWPAQEAGGLAKALRGSALGQPDGFHLMDEEGLPLQQGNFGERITLPEGPYRVQTQFANQTFEESLWINTETTTAVIFDASKVIPEHTEKTNLKSRPTTQQVKFCTQCGQSAMPNQSFCTGCGSRF